LSKIFGDSFEFFNILKPIDAIQAINTIHKDFKQTIKDHAKIGQHYEIIINGESADTHSLQNSREKINHIEIVPCILGKDPISAIVIGGLSVAAGAGAFGALGAFASAFFFTLGVGLIMAGITYLLTPIPEVEPREIEATVKAESFLFQSQNNTASQGSPVRLGYGRLRVGSQVISSAIRNRNIETAENPFASVSEDDGNPTFNKFALATALVPYAPLLI